RRSKRGRQMDSSSAARLRFPWARRRAMRIKRRSACSRISSKRMERSGTACGVCSRRTARRNFAGRWLASMRSLVVRWPALRKTSSADLRLGSDAAPRNDPQPGTFLRFAEGSTKLDLELAREEGRLLKVPRASSELAPWAAFAEEHGGQHRGGQPGAIEGGKR